MNLETMSDHMNKTGKHEYGKSEQVKPCQHVRQAFIVTRHSTETRCPGKATLDHPLTRQKDKALFGHRQLDRFQKQILLDSILHRLLSRVVLVHKGNFHELSRGCLNLLNQLGYLSAILFVGGHDKQAQLIAQGIDGQTNFTAFTPFAPIVAGSMVAFGTRLQRVLVKDGGGALFLSSLHQAQHGSQVVNHRFEHSCFQQPQGLLIDRLPWWQIIVHQAPRCSSSYNPAQPIEHFAQLMLLLRHLFCQQCQIGAHKGHSSSVTSLRCGFLSISESLSKIHKVHNRL